MHQRRQEPARLRQGGAGRLERRRLTVRVLPAAGAAPDGDGEPVRRRTRPDQARTDPRRRHHAAGRAHQPARHADRVAGRVDPRRVRSHQARSRTRPLQPREPEPAAVHARSSWPATGRRRSTATGESPSGSRRNWPSSRPPGDPTTSSRSSCTARWPTRGGSTPRSIRTNAPREALLPRRPASGEQRPGRPRPVLHAAQLAVAVELRRRQR